MAAVCSQMIAGGTTLLGDVATTSDALAARRLAGLPGITFFEVVGLRQSRWAPLRERAWGEVRRENAEEVGVSLHAPYSTARELFAEAGEFLTAVHWLESAHERRLFQEGQGPLRDFLVGIGAADAEIIDGMRIRQEAPSWFLDKGRWLLVHANYADSGDIERLAAGTSKGTVQGVVYCPRTHAAFRHSRHPAAELIEARITLALGTDSLASNPDMDVYGEAKFLTGVRPDLDPESIIRAITQGGAAALGRSRDWDWGSGTAEANLTIVAPPPLGSSDVSHEDVLAPLASVAGTMIRGRWRHGTVETGDGVP
jgi:cytosine/adenosine deaminase-related metal-dependent hydrolase